MLEHMDAEKTNFFMRRTWEDHLLRYQFARKFVKGKIVLDIASGDGYGASMLAASAKRVTGVELSENSTKMAKVKYSSNKNLNFIHSNALSFLKNNKKRYDVIVSFETIEHIAKYQLFLSLLKANLKPKGILILSTPEKRFSDFFAGGTFNPYHIKEFYYSEIKALCTKVFSNLPKVYLQRAVKKNSFFFHF